MQIGFPGLLALIFITLKLTGFIDWTWFWVLSPLWIGFVIWSIMAIVIFIVAFWSAR